MPNFRKFIFVNTPLERLVQIDPLNRLCLSLMAVFKPLSKKLKLLAFGIFIIYVLFITIVIFLWNRNIIFKLNGIHKHEILNVHIIGKAAIGQYLWLHLISGEIVYVNKGFHQFGNKTIKNINFIYLSGPGYIQSSIPASIEYMVLVLNGRTLHKVEKAKEWLDYLPSMPSLKKVAVILLGNEQCDNNWIIKYMKTNGGVIDVLFVVYDTSIVNGKEIFQWPLGVATYRGFPVINGNSSKHLPKMRAYKCNFIGTVYKNSSRETLMTVLKNSFLKDICYILPRERWVPEETSTTLHNYINTLQESDLTLCPVGVNPECYRIYEALSLGSVPVVEDHRTTGKCGSPLKLLKKFNAPVIYIRNWNHLNKLIMFDQRMNLTYILDRRKKILQWYHNFKKDIVSDFIQKIEKIFFGT